MSNRGCLILSVFLALAGNVKPASAQRPALQVQVYDYVGLKPEALGGFASHTREILADAGVSVEVMVCERGLLSLCGKQTASPRQLVIRIVNGEAKSMKNVRRPPLGQSFADHDGGTYASVFLSSLQDQAAEANVPWISVLAYAAAHEIGHLLLGDRAHTPRGLMKANWDRSDFQAMDQNHFHFCDEQIRQLTMRFGTSSRTDLSTDAALTSTR